MRFTGNVPIYEELANYYRRLIQQGALIEGTALPSVREVALNERINPNTVVRAYSLLVEEGFVTSIPKKGYFVSSAKAVGNKGALAHALRALMEEGYSTDDIELALQDIREGKA